MILSLLDKGDDRLGKSVVGEKRRRWTMDVLWDNSGWVICLADLSGFVIGYYFAMVKGNPRRDIQFILELHNSSNFLCALDFYLLLFLWHALFYLFVFIFLCNLCFIYKLIIRLSFYHVLELKTVIIKIPIRQINKLTQLMKYFKRKQTSQT